MMGTTGLPFGKWVREKVREELAAGTPRTRHDLVGAILPTLSFSHAEEAISLAVSSTVSQTLRDIYGASVPQEDGTRYYMRAEAMPLPGIVEYLSAQLFLAGGVQGSARVSAKEWVDAHPEAGLTVEDLLKMAADKAAGA